MRNSHLRIILKVTENSPEYLPLLLMIYQANFIAGEIRGKEDLWKALHSSTN